MNSVRLMLMRMWFLLQFCPPKLKRNHTTFHICHSEAGALRLSVAEDFHWVIAKLTRKQRRQNRYRLSLWITGYLGNRKTDHMTRFQCSSCEIARVKASGVTQCQWKGVTHPYPARALMADLDFLVVYKRVILKSDQEPSIVALCDALKNGWHGEIVPEASPKGETKSNGEVERAVQSVHGLPRTHKDFLEQQSGITLE